MRKLRGATLNKWQLSYCCPVSIWSSLAQPLPSIRPRRGGRLVISSNPADINECLTLGLCKDSECVNTRGSYLCTCRPGLMLDPSRSRCVCECWWGQGVGDTGKQDETSGSTG